VPLMVTVTLSPEVMVPPSVTVPSHRWPSWRHSPAKSAATTHRRGKHQDAAAVRLAHVQIGAIPGQRHGGAHRIRTGDVRRADAADGVGGQIDLIAGLAQHDVAKAALEVGMWLKTSTRSLPPSATNSRAPSDSAKRGKFSVPPQTGG